MILTISLLDVITGGYTNINYSTINNIAGEYRYQPLYNRQYYSGEYQYQLKYEKYDYREGGLISTIVW